MPEERYAKTADVASGALWVRRRTGMYVRNQVAATNASNLVNNEAYWAPIWVPPGTYDRIGIGVIALGESGSTARLGLYEDDGTGVPSTLLADYGSVAADWLGAIPYQAAQTIALTIDTPGRLLWGCAVLQNAPTTRPTVQVVGASMAALGIPVGDNRYGWQGFRNGTGGSTPGALPSPATAHGSLIMTNGPNPPTIGLRCS